MSFEEEMDEELRSHIELRADDLERTGLPRAEAERRARLEFGARERVKEEIREAAGTHFTEVLIQDARFSLRVLRKSPGFTLVAVATLALAIGANAVVFGVLNALILKPLDVPRAESLYAIQDAKSSLPGQTYPDYEELRDRNRSFEAIAGFNILEAALDAGDAPARTWLLDTTSNYFDALGIQPYLGRFFHASDEHGPGSAPYIVLSYTFWQNHFAADPKVVGRVVRMNKQPVTIIGVAPKEFHGTILFFFPDFFAPMVQAEPRSNFTDHRTHWVFMTLGHLKPGVTPAQAIADLNSVGAYLEKTYPQFDENMKYSLARPGLYGDFMGRPAKAFLSGLMLLSGLILLAACANLGSLFAARAADRSREVALRLALGASRTRILRQLLTEAVLVALAGGAAGLFGSLALLRVLGTWQPVPRFPLHMPVSPDAKVYLIALGLAIVSGILFGLVPVRQVLRTDPYQIVKSGQAGVPGRRIMLRDLLLAIQIAICAVLMTSSFVAVRGLERSLHANFGFDPEGAMLMDVDLEMAGYGADAVPDMQKRILDAVKAIPGVSAVGMSSMAPLVNGSWADSPVFTDQTTDLRDSNAVADAVFYQVSPDYFQAAGTRMLAGRDFNGHDDKTAPRVAVVNGVFARKLFGTVEQALGAVYKMPDGARIQVVGVVEDGRHKNLVSDPQLAMFFPLAQTPVSAGLVVRSSRDPQQLADAMRAALRRVAPAVPSYIQSWNQAMALPLFPSRAAAAALIVLGIMGATLALTGIFGMAAYSVSRRLKEIGIRLALGARKAQVLNTALGRAFKLLALGSIAGLALGIMASQVLAYVFYRAEPRDPLVLGGVVCAMLLLGLLATWIPAQRALSVDPLQLLREE